MRCATSFGSKMSWLSLAEARFYVVGIHACLK